MNVYYPFKKYDYVLNDKNIFLAEKIITLLEVWKKMGEFDFSTIDLHTLLHVFDWLNLHTINITLTAEWQVYVDVFRNELLSVIEKISNVVISINTNFENRFQKLIHVIINTWTNPVLEKLMKIENSDLNDDDINFFNFEQAHLISIRLIKLCNSNCEDLAINLATAFLRYLKTENLAQHVKISADQIWFIFDLRVALLYKFKEVQQVEEMVNILNYEDGIYFINRFVNKKPHLLKIWKYATKIAILAIQIFLEKIIKDNSSYYIFSQLLNIYTTISISTDALDEYFSKIKRLTEISDCVMLQNFCNFFKNINNPSLKSFIVEIFIKTLTALLNELEHHKDVQDLNRILIVTTRLAEIFCSLAEFMSDKIKVARECVLTAFSLEPTTERLQFMVDLALKSGLQITSSQEWICKLHPPVLQTDDVTWQCPECHEYMTKPQLDIPLKANLALNEAIQTLDLPETLCEDLIVCISNPRYQVLSWYLPWTVLHRLCVMYLKDPQATKNYVTELKFVDIDYSMFEGIKKEPLDEYSGIEKGYEKYLDKNFIPPEEEEEIEEENSESCAIEGEDYDPNSIESLKKILSIQNSQEEEVKKLQEGEYSGSRFNRNPRSILKSSFLKENSKNLLKQKNLSKDLRVIKMKSKSVTKDKNKRKVK